VSKNQTIDYKKYLSLLKNNICNKNRSKIFIHHRENEKKKRRNATMFFSLIVCFSFPQTIEPRVYQCSITDRTTLDIHRSSSLIDILYWFGHASINLY
jgi:hypothetical protein